MSNLCQACNSTDLELVETVSIDSLARAWAEENRYGREQSFETVRDYIFSDLQSERVEFWRCEVCGLEHSKPLASWTAKHYPHEEHGLGFDHQTALDILKRLPPSKVLDIGCADGQFLELGQQSGHNMTGVDFSEEDLIIARRRGLNVQSADVGNLNRIFEGQRFNVITLFQIIEHLNEPNEVFSQIGGLADKDSLLIVGCPADLRYTRVYDHPQRIERSDFWDYPPQHTLRWTPKALKTFLSRHGWKTETVMYEPSTLRGTAAHLTCLDGLNSDWYQNPLRRRLKTFQWMLKIAWPTFAGKITGIRLLVTARRSS